MNMIKDFVSNNTQFVMLFLGLVLSMAIGPFIIPFLKKLKFGQTVREEGPASHLSKSGTPTIGGMIFLIPILTIGSVLAAFRPEVIPVLVSTFFFGLIGFIDDYLKVVKKHKNGLSIKHKAILIVVFSAGFACYTIFTGMGYSIWLPFFGDVNSSIFYVIFVVLYFFGTINAVNFADGLDGLLGGLVIIVMAFIVFFGNLFMGEAQGIGLFASLVVGSCLGFLMYNLFPAKVFMGDTGALALGGALASMLLVLKIPLMIFVVGAIFVIEALSVAIQVFCFRVFGKRPFKMTPIHHHFELMGWKETTVVKVFWIFCALTSFVGAVIILKFF